MKNASLYYIHQTVEAYRSLLTSLCDEKTETVTVYSIFKTRVSPKIFHEIVKVQREVSAQRKIVFRNHAVFWMQTRLTLPMRRSLRQNDFFVDLVAEDLLAQKPKALLRCVKRLKRMGLLSQLWTRQGNQRQVYNAFEKLGLPFGFFRPQYDAQTTDWFDAWLHTPKAVAVNVFTDIITMLTLQVKSRNCSYASCIGKTLYADADGNMYACPFYPNEATFLGTQEDFSRPKQPFVDLVQRCVEKRETCVAQCNGFSYCEGGCPLHPEEPPNCQYYIKTVEHIRERLREVYEENRLAEVNSVVRNAILNGIAFNSAFLNERERRTFYGKRI